MVQERLLAFQAMRPEEAEVLAAAVRRIVPHKQPALQEVTWLTALAIDAQAVSDLGLRALLRDGVRDLDRRSRDRWGRGFAALGPGEQDSILREVEDSPFFQRLINLTVTDFYNRRIVWETIGYPGLHADGGYRDKGFDRLDW